MKPGATRPATADGRPFRAGLGSFLIHAIVICVLVGGGFSYRKLISPLEMAPAPSAPPIQMTLVPIILPPPVLPPTAPAVSTPSSATLPATDAPSPAALLKAKLAAHKRDGIAQHRLHKHIAKAPPTAPLPPLARAVLLKAPPKALPLLPPPPLAKKIPNKIPPHTLPIAPPVVAARGPWQVLREAFAEKPTPVQIPTLPSMPPPRASLAELPAPPVPSLPPVAPPRAVPVALPAPIPAAPVVVAAPAPLVVAEAPVPVVAPVPPAPPDESMTPLAPKSTPDFSLIPGPDRTQFPRPPYPYSARNAGLSGTVIVNVQFDQRGGVVSAEVTQSSGVKILDLATKSFILSHWHLPSYAGQSVSVPIIFQLDQP